MDPIDMFMILLQISQDEIVSVLGSDVGGRVCGPIP